MKPVKPKPNTFYWNIIESMGWAEATMSGEHRPYERIKREFMETYSEKVAVHFNTWYAAMYRQLVDAYDAARKESGERYGNFGGDDSFDDMMNHVMGLGQEYYNAIMANFKLLNKLEPKESFAYCIPHVYENMNDYNELKIETHKAGAVKCVKELSDMVASGEVELEDFAVIRELMTRFINLVEGNALAAVGDLDFDRDYNRLYDFKSNHTHAMFANTLFDCKKNML